MSNTIGIRVDIDFEIGLVKGVPHLLKLFEKYGIKATFFVTMGHDGFKHNTKRLNSTNYLKRVLSFNPVKIISMFGLSYLVKQFFGYVGNVGGDHSDMLRRIVKEGHELGVHGYNHFWWAENIWNCETQAVREEMNKGLDAFKNATGIEANVWASPNWRCSKDSLHLVDEFGFLYGADCRGKHPFLPMDHNWQGKTIQLPITLPCLHEVKQYLARNTHERIIHELLSHITLPFNVLCIHGYYEGILERELFIRFIHAVKSKGVQFFPLKQVFERINKSSVPLCKVTRKTLPGGRGEISFQGEEC